MATHTLQVSRKEEVQIVLFFLLTPAIILLGLLSYVTDSFFWDTMRSAGTFISMWNATTGLLACTVAFAKGKFQKPFNIIGLSGLCSASMLAAAVASSLNMSTIIPSVVGYILAGITVFLGIKHMLK